MLLLRLGTRRPEKVPQWASVRPCSRSPLHWVLRKWFSYHVVNFFPMKFNISVLVLGFKTISYCNNFYDWLFQAKKKKKRCEKHFCPQKWFFLCLMEHTPFCSSASFKEREEGDGAGVDILGPSFCLWSPGYQNFGLENMSLCLGSWKWQARNMSKWVGLLLWYRSWDLFLCLSYGGTSASATCYSDPTLCLGRPI